MSVLKCLVSVPGCPTGFVVVVGQGPAVLATSESPHDKTNKVTMRPSVQSDQSFRCALNG